MAESVTPQPSPARERLEASIAGVSHTVSDVVGALLDNLPLVLEAAEEAGKAAPATHEVKSHWQAENEGPCAFACNNCEGEYVWGGQAWVLR